MTLARYFAWHYGDGFRRAVGLAQNLMLLPVHFFSVKELAKTLFEPWKQITVEHPRSLLSTENLMAFWNNLISRVLGAIVRSILIGMGLGAALCAGFAAVVLLIGWLAAPGLPILFFFLGIAFL